MEGVAWPSSARVVRRTVNFRERTKPQLFGSSYKYFLKIFIKIVFFRYCKVHYRAHDFGRRGALKLPTVGVTAYKNVIKINCLVFIIFENAYIFHSYLATNTLYFVSHTSTKLFFPAVFKSLNLD